MKLKTRKFSIARVATSFLIIVAVLPFTHDALAQRRTPTRRTTAINRTATMNATRIITINTQPNAQVWIDDVRRGTTDESGKLIINNVNAGRRALRVRAAGFTEKSQPLLVASNQIITVRLTPTTDAAELAFQQAEIAREQGGAGLPTAIEAYKRALTLRPRFPAARVGFARALSDAGDYEAALEQIESARAARPIYPEASAVEGRIYRSQGDADAAIAAFNRAIKEGRGYQPEAYTGLGLLYESQDNHAASIPAFEKAIQQLADTEPVLYQLLGAAYEQTEDYKRAVAAYEKYLQLAPTGKLAPAIKSVIEQLRRQAAGENVLQP